MSIDFVLYLENGTVADTNNPKLAEEVNLSNYVKGSYTFILGQSGKVKGFDEVLRGMRKGEHKELIIEPSEKEVVLNISKVRVLKRYLTVHKNQRFPRSAFENLFKKSPIIGDVVVSEELAFKYQVINMSNRTVLTKMLLREGEEYVLPNTEWKSRVSRVATEDAIFYQIPEENQTIDTPFGPAFINFTPSAMFINFQPKLNKIFKREVDLGSGFRIPQEFQIVEIGEKEFTIKRWMALEEKRLKLVVDLLEVTENVKEVKQKKLIVTEVNSGIEN